MPWENISSVSDMWSYKLRITQLCILLQVCLSRSHLSHGQGEIRQHFKSPSLLYPSVTSTVCCHVLRPWNGALEKEPGRRTGHKSCLLLTDVEGRTVTHPVPFWIVFLCFIHFFFMVKNSLQNHPIESCCCLFGSISNIKISQLEPMYFLHVGLGIWSLRGFWGIYIASCY